MSEHSFFVPQEPNLFMPDKPFCLVGLPALFTTTNPPLILLLIWYFAFLIRKGTAATQTTSGMVLANSMAATIPPYGTAAWNLGYGTAMATFAQDIYSNA